MVLGVSTDEPEKPAALHVKVPRELHGEVVDYASRTERSLNKAVIFLIRKGLEAERPKAP